MMDDIVDRLRARKVPNFFRPMSGGKLPDVVDPLCAQAAAEIERLRKVLQAYGEDEHCGLCERLVSSGELARQALGADHAG